jgi:endonuclease/exonuclease/phosphatase (EEP) superfamily protein YafD
MLRPVLKVLASLLLLWLAPPLTSGQTLSKTVLSDSAELVVLSWNAHKENENEAWRKRLSEWQASYHPHVIALQEAIADSADFADNADFSDSTTPPSGAPFSHNTASRLFLPNLNLSNRKLSGAMILSETPAICSGGWLTTHLEAGWTTPKPLLWAEFPWSSAPDSSNSLLVVNLHALNFTTLGPFRTELLRIGKQIAAHSGESLLLGDFNTWSSARQSLVDSLAESLGLKEHRPAPGPVQRKRFLGHPLDHIYHTRGLLPVAEMLVLDPAGTSDHPALLVRYRAAPQSQSAILGSPTMPAKINPLAPQPDAPAQK